VDLANLVHAAVTRAATPGAAAARLAQRALREPLLHFLVAGALLFLVHAFVSGDASPGAGRIMVSSAQIADLRAVFERTWQRPPTRDELQGLIDSHVREEVLFREGLALGLDRDDPLIRRRVRQKVDLLAEHALAGAEPTEQQLQAYLDANRARFTPEPRYTLRQVYVDPTRPGRDTGRETARLLAELNRLGLDAAAARSGDATQLPFRVEATPASELAQLFGPQFSPALAALPAQRWSGPVASAYGLHLVYVEQKVEHPAELAAVRTLVRREYEREQRAAATEAFYRGLLQRYTVTIENAQVADNARGIAASRP